MIVGSVSGVAGITSELYLACFAWIARCMHRLYSCNVQTHIYYLTYKQRSRISPTKTKAEDCSRGLYLTGTRYLSGDSMKNESN